MQHIQALAMGDGRDLADSDELLLFDRFAKENDFSYALHEGGIAALVWDANEQDDDNNYGDINTNEDPDNPAWIALDPESARGEIAGAPP